ncbi:endonuclease/exonuclease/phosphatase family protein [Lentzea sp. NPDC102401]|uniref:endonuclease/exonuclease/phosphatase family protein n=1 Tax=Lentzea sp. NPDC102401 TaxID=3364128 RepID=UPI003813BCAD
MSEPGGDSARFSVGVFNIEHFGVDRATGRHSRLPLAVDFIRQTTPVPPDVLILPECTRFDYDGHDALRRVVNELSRALPHGELYEPFVDHWGERRNPPGVLVNRAKFEVDNYYEPNSNAGPYKGVVKTKIDGIAVVFIPDHWPGGAGRPEFDRSAQRWKPWSTMNTVAGGDLNITSSWGRDFRFAEPAGPSWYQVCERRGELHKLKQKGRKNPVTGEWEIDTEALDELRELGWTDAGEEADNPTITDPHPADGLGLRIDRILRSPGFNGEQVPDSYFCAQSPSDVSDHAYVGASFIVHR